MKPKTKQINKYTQPIETKDTFRDLGQNRYEVKSFRDLDTTYIVDLEADTCTCMAWQMGRRPCKHTKYVRTLMVK